MSQATGGGMAAIVGMQAEDIQSVINKNNFICTPITNEYDGQPFGQQGDIILLIMNRDHNR